MQSDVLSDFLLERSMADRRECPGKARAGPAREGEVSGVFLPELLQTAPDSVENQNLAVVAVAVAGSADAGRDEYLIAAEICCWHV
jgi:hypothetical protein